MFIFLCIPLNQQVDQSSAQEASNIIFENIAQAKRKILSIEIPPHTKD
jgi:hypothetical protein